MANPQKSLDQPSLSELKQLSDELKRLQAEESRRLLARKDLLTFASSISIPTAPLNTDPETEEFETIKGVFGAHHLLWLKLLQDVEDGKLKRLMGLMPP